MVILISNIHILFQFDFDLDHEPGMHCYFDFQNPGSTPIRFQFRLRTIMIRIFIPCEPSAYFFFFFDKMAYSIQETKMNTIQIVKENYIHKLYRDRMPVRPQNKNSMISVDAGPLLTGWNGSSARSPPTGTCKTDP